MLVQCNAVEPSSIVGGGRTDIHTDLKEEEKNYAGALKFARSSGRTKNLTKISLTSQVWISTDLWRFKCIQNPNIKHTNIETEINQKLCQHCPKAVTCQHIICHLLVL